MVWCLLCKADCCGSVRSKASGMVQIRVRAVFLYSEREANWDIVRVSVKLRVKEGTGFGLCLQPAIYT